MKTVASNTMFGGVQHIIEHPSKCCACPMTFGLYLPPGKGPFPVLVFLSGLTCTEQNFVTKAGAQRVAAELGMAIIAPDTSPRGQGVADDEGYDFGQGAGFYVDATEEPFQPHFQMASYISQELWAIIEHNEVLDDKRVGISGHSMGGHGALTLHLRHPEKFRSVSAFAPIVAPSRVPWGRKALAGYLGDNSETWRPYDACELVSERASHAHILIDQGADDEFLANQLKPELFQAACSQVGQTLTLQMREGYDHSYFFVASFIEEHVRHHYQHLSQ
ncbi:MAG: S-formylglutathione hydrolase [Lysobacterales bacterium]